METVMQGPKVRPIYSICFSNLSFPVLSDSRDGISYAVVNAFRPKETR